MLRDGGIILAPCPRPGRPDEESVEKGQALVEAVLNPCARAAEMVVRRAWPSGWPSAGRSIAHAGGQEPASPLPSAVLVPTPTRTCRYSDNAITQKEMQMRELATVRTSEGWEARGGNICHASPAP